MAITQFAFCAIDGALPAPYAASATFEVKAASGSSSQTTATANASQNMCRVATDTAVYIAFGSNPTASSTGGYFLPAGGESYFRVRSGDKGALIAA